MKAWLRTRLDSAQWNPGFLGFITNPYYFARTELWKGLRNLAGTIPAGRMLDVGCGASPYRCLFSVESYTGLELDTPANRSTKAADLWYDGQTFPLPDRSCDIVLCSQVLEHVFNPQVFISEIARVLRPGGILLLTIPFVWDEHEQPCDFARYTRFGLDHMCQSAGLTTERRLITLDDARLLAQLAGSQAAKHLARIRWSPLRLALSCLWCIPVHVSACFARCLLPWTRDLYLDQIVVLRRDMPRTTPPLPSTDIAQ